METETALLWGFIILILLVLTVITLLLIHSGLLEPVDVKTCKPDVGEIQIAYKFAQGPYKESGMLFTEVHSLLPQYRTLGVYYDDPNKRQPHKLRYIVGVILAENGSTVDAEHVKLLEENNYKFATFPSIDHAVQTTFPFTSTISIIVGIMKVYPALREYIEYRSLCARPFLEIYDNKKSKILFVGPLARQDDFYVPEVLQEEEDNREEEDYEDDRTENSSRSWDESASFVRGAELNDSECSESVGDDSVSRMAPPSPPALASAAMPPPAPPAPLPTEREDTPPQPPAVAAPAGAEAIVPAAVAAVVPPVEAAAPAYAPPADIGDAPDAGSAGDESDANTGSSFEEIDEREAAAMLALGTQDGALENSIKKDDDEGER